MNETVISTLVGFAGGALAGDGVIFALATVAVDELKRQLAAARKSADDWHKLWAKVNNHLDNVRTACKELKVPLRGKDGKIVGSANAWKVVSEAIKNV